ncbi:polysaccharide deacetylase family protein [Cryptosporangium sp. NPDC048952]|uniref:polysaccharide deacetylase family protein n=1 Tax=Cryptosporangium sp. NPDC048952 TaxID=3363961 RepID=UPI00371C8774
MKALLRALTALAVLALGLVGAAPASADTSLLGPAPLTVSLTFDDGFASQVDAVKLLSKHDLNGTFYIINGLVDTNRYLTWEQITRIAAAGNEIGGHTVTHPHLDKLPYAQAKAEICDNRATLLALGFQVTNFAYPYGSSSADNEKQAKECGYNSARDVSGLVNAQNGGCLDCELSNPVPPTNPYRVLANSSTTDDLAGLKRYVTQAQASGSGWVPLIFHRFCATPEACAEEKKTDDEWISLTDFDALLTWLTAQPGVVVKTMQQVVGGIVQPSVGTPTAASLTAFKTVNQPAPLSQTAAIRPLGVPIGQTQVLLGGIGAAVIIAGTYRLARRGRRYVG